MFSPLFGSKVQLPSTFLSLVLTSYVPLSHRYSPRRSGWQQGKLQGPVSSWWTGRLGSTVAWCFGGGSHGWGGPGSLQGQPLVRLRPVWPAWTGGACFQRLVSLSGGVFRTTVSLSRCAFQEVVSLSRYGSAFSPVPGQCVGQDWRRVGTGWER